MAQIDTLSFLRQVRGDQKVNRQIYHSMSRQTNFDLKAPAGGLTVKIVLQKTTDECMSFTQTYPDEETGQPRQVRTAKVLAINDVTPRSLEDVERVIPWNSVQKSHSYRDADGVPQLMCVEEALKGKVFTKSSVMAIVGILDASQIRPRMYDGSHYFLNVQSDSKTKSAAKIDRQGYGLYYYLCRNYEKVIFVKFISGEREKFAVIYADDECLMLSILIHETYQRAPPEVTMEPVASEASGNAAAEKLIKIFSLPELDPDMLQDSYELWIKQYLEEMRELQQEAAEDTSGAASGSGSSGGARVLPKLRVQPVSLDDDFLAQIGKL